MATIYAIAPLTAKGEHALTPCRAYEVVAEDGLGGFRIFADGGYPMLCLWSGCAHLNGGDWTRAKAAPLGDQ